MFVLCPAGEPRCRSRFQVALHELAYAKVGAALFGLMMFTWCGGLTERCTRIPGV